MANLVDVAKYILTRTGPVAPMKLQKLVYYSQAWHTVWKDGPLFNSRIEAWANGPVSPDLYGWHRGTWSVDVSAFKNADVSRLQPNEMQTIDSVIAFYGDKSAQWLSDLTHREQPWLDARRGLAQGERGNVEITPAAMQEYYGSLE